MRTKVIISVLFFLLLIGGMIFIYFKFYEPRVDRDLVNVSISAEYDRKRIKTGFSINDGEYAGNTSLSYELIKIPKQLMKIKNVNLEGQDYYENELVFNITEDTRIDLILDRPSSLDIDVDYEENKVILDIFSQRFTEVIFCLKGSFNYLFIRAVGFEEIDKVDNFKNYERCYDGNFSLENDNKIINITYLKLGELNELDYINISFIDKSNNTVIKKIK